MNVCYTLTYLEWASDKLCNATDIPALCFGGLHNATETLKHAIREHNYVCQLIPTLIMRTDEVRVLCFQYFISV
jgi:hypothetical protein